MRNQERAKMVSATERCFAEVMEVERYSRALIYPSVYAIFHIKPCRTEQQAFPKD